MTVPFILMPENEVKLLTKIKNNKLTSHDGGLLVEYGDLFIKFLNKTRLSYQLKLSEGTAKGKEAEIYIAMQTIDEIIKSIKEIPDVMERHNEKQLQKTKK